LALTHSKLSNWFLQDSIDHALTHIYTLQTGQSHLCDKTGFKYFSYMTHDAKFIFCYKIFIGLASDQSKAKNVGRQLMIIARIEAHNKIEIESEKKLLFCCSKWPFK